MYIRVHNLARQAQESRPVFCFRFFFVYLFFKQFLSDLLSQNQPDRFSPNFQVGRTVDVDDQSEISFSIPQGRDVAMATEFC